MKSFSDIKKMDRREADVLEKMTDAGLIKEIQEHPEAGLKIALEVYGGAVKTICGNILGRDKKNDIEECVSEVFFQLWKDSGRYHPDYPLKNYIYGIARYTALKMRKKLLKNEQTVTVEWISDEIASGADTEDVVAENENAEAIYAEILTFSFLDKEIFLYRYYFWFSIQEIADMLNLSYKAVENRLYRGKEKLRQKLTERGIAL